MKRYKISIEPDGDIENPAKWDHSWTVYSFSRNHGSFVKVDDREQFRTIGFKRKLAVGLAFPLQYFEHGEGEWALSGQGSVGTDCPWDCVKFAGFIVWENEPKNIGAKTKEDRAKDAKAFLETYNDWFNGRGCHYNIEKLGECQCCDDPAECECDDIQVIDDVDSCGGFYNHDADSMFEQIGENLRADGWDGDESSIQWAGDLADMRRSHSLQPKPKTTTTEPAAPVVEVESETPAESVTA